MKRKLFQNLLAIVMATFVSLSASAVPPMISYQGKLMDSAGAPIADGAYSMQFSIYDIPTGGTALWTETNTNVVVTNGLFAVMIGSVSALPAAVFDSPDRYFGIAVDGDPETSPRQRIASVAFAQISQTVVDGAISTAKLADGSVTAAKLGPDASGVPAGVIVMWSGAATAIPTGWALCDGTNGTPNLQEKFVIGAGGAYTAGSTGGKSVIELAHSHTVNDHVHNANHSHGMDAAGDHAHHMDFWTQGSPHRTDYYKYAPDGYKVGYPQFLYHSR